MILMKKIKIILLLPVLIISTLGLTGCWDNREIDNLAIVAGLAIDKGTYYRYRMSVELINIESGKETKISTKIVTTEATTMFDAARDMISIVGKRLYWKHAKILVVSQEVANMGITNVTDWYTRNAQTRGDIQILVATTPTAKEILDGQSVITEIKSFAVAEMLKNQESLAKAPKTNVLTFSIQTNTKGLSIVVPAIDIKEMDGKRVPQLNGAAVIKADKLIGFLNVQEVKDLLFIQDEVKGGILVEQSTNKETEYISLQILKNKTKKEVNIEDDKIKMKIDVDTTVALGETSDCSLTLEKEEIERLEQKIADSMKKRMEALTAKMKTEYEADVFGFGAFLQQNKAQEWKKTEDNWGETFKNLDVEINTKIRIKNTGTLLKPAEKKE